MGPLNSIFCGILNPIHTTYEVRNALGNRQWTTFGKLPWAWRLRHTSTDLGAQHLSTSATAYTVLQQLYPRTSSFPMGCVGLQFN